MPKPLEGEQYLHALDLFGASKMVSSCFESHGYHAKALDYLLGGKEHDLLTQEGWFNWLDHLMMLSLVQSSITRFVVNSSLQTRSVCNIH